MDEERPPNLKPVKQYPRRKQKQDEQRRDKCPHWGAGSALLCPLQRLIWRIAGHRAMGTRRDVGRCWRAGWRSWQERSGHWRNDASMGGMSALQVNPWKCSQSPIGLFQERVALRGAHISHTHIGCVHLYTGGTQAR